MKLEQWLIAKKQSSLLVISKEGHRNPLHPGSNNAFLLCVIPTMIMLTDASLDTNCYIDESELDGFTIW